MSTNILDDFRKIDQLSDKDFEFFVKDLLLASGWTDATITEVGKEYRHGDGGVDIFAYKAGRKFAIEVKQRNINTTVDVSALNQLVTGAKLAKVQNMILVTNSYFTSEVKVRALRIGVELIDREDLKSLYTLKGSEIGRNIKPREYQTQVIQDALTKFNTGSKKILIEMATGLGKTYTVALLIKQLIEKQTGRSRVIFIAHQIEILLQSVTAFKNVLGIGTYSFSACFAGSPPEETDFVFASFDTLHSQLKNLHPETFDFVVIDEAHHTPARTYSEVVENFNPKLLIGLTATPTRSDEKNVFDYFGGADGHIGKYDLVWALKHKKLAFPKYLVLLDDIDPSKISQLDTGLSIADIDKRLFLHKKDAEVVRIIEDTIQKKEIRNIKGIVFCRNIKHLKHLIGFFKLGSATTVHSKMTDQERRENIRNFREGDYKYILVCDLFNEGIDIPEANLLIFMRYTGSKTIWLQQLGRGLRKTPNKDYVHVLDFVGSLERLNDVRTLTQAVKAKKLEIENIEDTEEATNRNDVFHDDSFEVHYSESAAKVLDLIESLKYRLNSREILIDKLREKTQEIGEIPCITEIDTTLDNVTTDQISTHFDSYFGFLTAAFGENFDREKILAPIAEHIKFNSSQNFTPSYRAIALNFYHKNLLLCSETEISRAFPNIHTKEIIKNNQETTTEKTPQETTQDMLITKYKETIKNRNQLNQLSDIEKNEILDIFKSPSIFIKALKDRQHD